VDFQNLYFFVKVVAKGSFVAAAKELRVPTSTLSRRIQQLEQQLGYQLLYRSARRLSLSEAGSLFYRRCQPLFEGLENATDELAGELTAPKGRLKITAPISLANNLLNPWLFEFIQLHPGIELDLLVDNRNVDLKNEGVDLAFRIGDVRIPDWISRPSLQAYFKLCAAPDLLARFAPPTNLAELAQLPLLISRRIPTWIFMDGNGQAQEFNGHARITYDELAIALEAAVRGLGVANLPDYVADAALADGRLQLLMPGWRPVGRPVHLVYPHREFLPTKVRLLIDFMLSKAARWRS